MFWAGVKKVDPMKKLEAICREAGDVRSFNKWRGKHRDIDLNAVLVGSKHPLHLACSKGFVDLVTCMVQLHGVAADVVDLSVFAHCAEFTALTDSAHVVPVQNSCTALHYAASGGFSPMVEYLVERCCLNVGAVAANGHTVIHFACAEGHWRIVHYILACGASYEYSRKDGCTGLMLAAQVGQLETVKYLFERNVCNINEIDFGGNTALHFAAVEGHTDIVRYLLTCVGINPGLRNAAGLTAVQMCPAPALIALIHRMSHEVKQAGPAAPPILSPAPHKRISFQKRPFIDDNISELSTDPFESEDLERRRPSMMSQRNSGMSISGMSASSLLMQEMLLAEQKFDETVAVITKLIGEFAGLPLGSAEKEVDLMLTWASDRANTVMEVEAHSSIMAAVIRRRSYRLSARSSIGLSLDAKALRELLLLKSPSPSASGSLPATPQHKVSPAPSPLNQSRTSKTFFPDSPKGSGTTPPPGFTVGAQMIKEGSFESISGDSVGQAEQLEFISPDADRLHYLEQDIQSIGKFAKAVDSNDRTDDFLSNTDSEAAAGQLPPAVDPYICGEEARLLWPGTHTPATSPIPSDDEREKLQKVTVVQLSPKREKDVDSLLPPPFPPSMEFIDSAEVINDHEGMPVLPWGSGETRQSPRLSRSVRSPRSASPRGAIDDVSDDVSMFLSLETGRKSSSGLAPRSSLRAVPRDEEGAPLSFDSEPNIRRSSLKVTPIMSPAAKRPIERVGGAAFDIDISGSANPEVDLDGEEIILVRTSPRPSYRRLSGPPEDICVSRPDDIGNGSSPRVRSISSDHGATSPARSRQLEGVTEINLSSLLYVTEDSDEEVTPDESYSRATEVQMKTQSLQSETPIQMMHRKARLMLANSRSSDRKLINFSDLTDSSSKSVLSPINSTPSHQKISDLNSKITDGTAKNLFGTHGSDDLDSSGLDTNDVFTPSQWEYLSTLLEKAAEEESGVSPHRPAPPIVSSMFADRTDTASQMDKIAREKQQEKVVKAGHKLAVKILAKYFQRAQIDNNIEFLVTAWAKLLRNAKRAKKAAEDEEEVDEWTLRYKRFTQSREGAHLGLGLRLSAGKPQNYAQKPEPTRSVSVDRGLRRNNNGSSDYSAAATDGRGRRAKSPSTTPLATPRAADDGDVSLSQKGNLKKTFLSPLWIPPPDYELEAPVMPASASGRRSVRSGSKLELYNGSPRTVGSPRPSDRWGFGETPRAEKRNSFNESNILSSPETPSAIKSLRNPIKQEEEELRRQLMLHHQLHAQNSSGSLLGAMEDADGADSMSGASSIIPPPLDWSQVDLESLGVMPDQIVPTLKANETVLWRLYCAYVLSEDGLSAATRSIAQSGNGRRLTQVMVSRRLLSFEVLYTMLKDFDVCPAQCSKKMLLAFCKEIMETASSMSGGGGSGSFDLGDDETNTTASLLLKRTWDEKKNRICFVDFKKVLWRLARDCVKSSAYAHPSMRLCKLLRMMDSGPGRAKLSRSSRSSTLLPAFVLFEATSSGVPSSAFSPPTSDSKKKLRQSWPVKGAHGSPLVAAELFASVRDEVNISQTEETGKFTTKLSIAPAVATISTDKIVSPATEPRVSSPTKSRSTSSRATVKGIQTSSARSIVEKPSVSAVVSPIVQNVTTSAPERSQTIITSRSEARKTHLNPLTAKSVMAHSSKTAVLREHPSYATQSYPVKKK